MQGGPGGREEDSRDARAERYAGIEGPKTKFGPQAADRVPEFREDPT